MTTIPIRCKYDEMVPTKELKKKINPNNTNKHPKEQVDRLAKLMAYQGVRKPVYINKNTGFIQAGHGRLLAAIKLGLKEYPVESQDYDNDEQALADLTADNAIASWAELDMSMVNEQLEAMTSGFNKDLF
jgi:ParB-like chromosome segregation protein Spo0J